MLNRRQLLVHGAVAAGTATALASSKTEPTNPYLRRPSNAGDYHFSPGPLGDTLCAHHIEYLSLVAQWGALSAVATPERFGCVDPRAAELRQEIHLHDVYFASLSPVMPSALDASSVALLKEAETVVHDGIRQASAGIRWFTFAIDEATHRLESAVCFSHEPVHLAHPSPLIAVDLHAHAYRTGFGTNVSRYVDELFDEMRRVAFHKRGANP